MYIFIRALIPPRQYRPATGPAGERDEREPSLGGADQANEAAARREHEEQVYGRGYTHPFCARWQHGTDRRPTTPGGADADRDGGVLFADGSRVRRVAAGEETRVSVTLALQTHTRR